MNIQKLAKQFDADYDSEWEATATFQLLAFQERFPLNSLKKITLEKYAIGGGARDTYCYWLEIGTRDVAQISGSPARKFGVYFGVSKKDQRGATFRYTTRFAGDSPEFGAEQEVFRIIKRELLHLIDAGKSLDFDAIDSNRLAPMVKAKVLCLHFPDTYGHSFSRFWIGYAERLAQLRRTLSELRVTG